MNYVEISVNDIVYNPNTKDFENKGEKVFLFRLTSENAVQLEETAGESLSEFVGDFSMKNVVTMLRYMLKWEKPNFSMSEAYKVYDLLVLNGYTLEDIQKKIIMKTLIASGFFTEEQVNSEIDQ